MSGIPLEGRWAMDWKTRMRTDEAELKQIVDRLAEIRGEGLRTKIEREYAMLTLSRKLADMRSFVEDCLSGRNTWEKSLMEYKVRIEYPLYSHLDSLSALSREYVDWSA
jgi:hypothetical protein